MQVKRCLVIVAALGMGLAGEVHAQVPVRAQDYRNPYGGWRPIRTAQSRSYPSSGYGSYTPRPSYRPEPWSGPTRYAAASIQQKATPFLGPWDQGYGQVWREYDILPYTLRVRSTSRAEQAIVDWIIRETGQDTWHGEKIAVLAADRNKLRVYHEPAVQAQVASIVDRFVQGGTEPVAVNVRLIGVGDPDWRRRVYGLLRPLGGSTHGPQAWLVEKEDAALMRSELMQRRDYRLHSNPYMVVSNGQPATVRLQGQRSYVRDVFRRTGDWPGHQTRLDYVDEGLAMEVNPLLTVDRQYVDADVKIHLDQLEKLHDVPIDVPTPLDPRQVAYLQVPQVVQRRVEERFRWPVSHALLVSLGIAPPATPTNPSPFPFSGPQREEMLVFIELEAGGALRGPTARATSTNTTTSQSAYRYRYRPRTASYQYRSYR